MLLCPTVDDETDAIDVMPPPTGRVPLSGIFFEEMHEVPGGADAAPVEGMTGATNVTEGLFECLCNSVWVSLMSKFATCPSTGDMQVAGTGGGAEGDPTLTWDTQQRLMVGTSSTVLLVGWDGPGAHTEGGATGPEAAFRKLDGTSGPYRPLPR